MADETKEQYHDVPGDFEGAVGLARKEFLQAWKDLDKSHQRVLRARAAYEYRHERCMQAMRVYERMKAWWDGRGKPEEEES